MNGKLYGVGVGPGDPDLITLKAIKTIKACEVIAVPKTGETERVAFHIAKQSIPELESKEMIELYMPMTRDKQLLSASHDKAADAVIDLLKQGKSVAFLTLGDPSIYSTYIYVHKRVIEKGYEAQLVAGVPSFCAVAARLNIELTEGAQPLHVIPASYHGVDEGIDWNGTKVLMKTGKSIGAVKEILHQKGLYNSAKMVQRCGMDGEQVFQSLDDADENTSYFSIIVIKDGE